VLASLLLACAADPVPGEWFIPGEIPAEVAIGAPDSGFGSAVAVSGGRWLVASPAARRVEVVGEGALEGMVPAAVWFDGEAALAGFAGEGVFEVLSGAPVQETPDARVFAGEAGLWVAAGNERVRASDGREWVLADTRALAVGEGRILALACGGGCRAWELGEGAPLELGEAGEEGRVALWGGLAWWSDPQTADPDGAGRVRSEAGDERAGDPGDHLGRGLGGGYASGTMNPNQAPVRARIVSLEGGATLAFDRAAETRPLALAGDGDTLLIGAPAIPHTSGVIGAVFGAAVSDLP
jgi:hypothetical protein